MFDFDKFKPVEGSNIRFLDVPEIGKHWVTNASIPTFASVGEPCKTDVRRYYQLNAVSGKGRRHTQGRWQSYAKHVLVQKKWNKRAKKDPECSVADPVVQVVRLSSNVMSALTEAAAKISTVRRSYRYRRA